MASIRTQPDNEKSQKRFASMTRSIKEAVMSVVCALTPEPLPPAVDNLEFDSRGISIENNPRKPSGNASSRQEKENEYYRKQSVAANVEASSVANMGAALITD